MRMNNKWIGVFTVLAFVLNVMPAGGHSVSLDGPGHDFTHAGQDSQKCGSGEMSSSVDKDPTDVDNSCCLKHCACPATAACAGVKTMRNGDIQYVERDGAQEQFAVVSARLKSVFMDHIKPPPRI